MDIERYAYDKTIKIPVYTGKGEDTLTLDCYSHKGVCYMNVSLKSFSYSVIGVEANQFLSRNTCTHTCEALDEAFALTKVDPYTVEGLIVVESCSVDFKMSVTEFRQILKHFNKVKAIQDSFNKSEKSIPRLLGNLRKVFMLPTTILKKITWKS